jgi:hypothetical protein
MARTKATPCAAADDAAKKKAAVKNRLASLVAQRAAEEAATQRSSETPPRAVEEGASSTVLFLRMSLRSRKVPTFLGKTNQSPTCSGSRVPAPQFDGNEGLIHSPRDHDDVPKSSDNHEPTSGNNHDIGVEQGTADGDENGGGVQFIASDDELDNDYVESKDEDEEVSDEEKAPP